MTISTIGLVDGGLESSPRVVRRNDRERHSTDVTMVRSTLVTRRLRWGPSTSTIARRGLQTGARATPRRRVRARDMGTMV